MSTRGGFTHAHLTLVRRTPHGPTQPGNQAATLPTPHVPQSLLPLPLGRSAKLHFPASPEVAGPIACGWGQGMPLSDPASRVPHGW